MVRLLILSFAFFFGAQAMAADCGRFAVVKQPVQFKKQGKEELKKARKNAKICQGDTIVTGDDGRAKIVMADKNEINISPNSEMVIETYVDGQKAVLNVINGKVRSDVVKDRYKNSKSSHFRVKTKSAVAGVRGTQFLTSYDAKTNLSRVVTFRGKVEVGRMVGGNFVGKVMVEPGQYTSNSTKTEPHPAKEVSPQELAKIDRESKVGDTSSGSKAPASTPQQNQDDKDDAQQDDQGNQEQPAQEEPKQEADANQPTDDSQSTPPEQTGGDQAENSPDEGTIGATDPGAVDGAEGDGTFNDSNPERDVASVDPKEYERDDMEFDPNQEGGDRDLASIDMDGVLPEPELDIAGGTGDVMPQIDTGNITTIDNLLQPVPDVCGTSCNDAVINQKVKVIIVPKLPN